MQYTYEIAEAENGWIVNIFKDNFIIMQQPHHPQQVLTATEKFWTSREAAGAWAQETIDGFNNAATLEAEIIENSPPDSILPVNEQAELMKQHLASLLGISVDQIQVAPPATEE